MKNRNRKPVEQNEISNWTDEDDESLRVLLAKRLKTKRGDETHDIKFVTDLLSGEDGESLIVDALSHAEIKKDFGVGDTGNVFIEHSSWSKDSGIITSTADFWIFVFDGDEFNSEVFVGIKTDRLRKLLENNKWEVRGGDNKSSKGKLLRVTSLLKPNKRIGLKPVKKVGKKNDRVAEVIDKSEIPF